MNSYDSASSFRQSLEDRLRSLGQGDSRSIQRLRRRIAFERLLARIQHKDQSWILKGGMAMEMRLGERARLTRDVDLGLASETLLQTHPSIQRVGESFREAAGQELPDHFAFEVEVPQKLPIADAEVFRFFVQAKVARRRFEILSVDVAIRENPLAPPEIVAGSDLLAFAAIPPISLQLVSRAQHFAEKLLALTKRWDDRENTRAKDLVDLILLLEMGLPPKDELRPVVFRAFAEERESDPPPLLPQPPSNWEFTFPPLAREVGLKEKTVAQAFATLSAFWSELMRSP